MSGVSYNAVRTQTFTNVPLVGITTPLAQGATLVNVGTSTGDVQVDLAGPSLAQIQAGQQILTPQQIGNLDAVLKPAGIDIGDQLKGVTRPSLIAVPQHLVAALDAGTVIDKVEGDITLLQLTDIVPGQNSGIVEA